ncbi:MAG: serine hydrolase domain-containing protein [Mycobacterium sp.]
MTRVHPSGGLRRSLAAAALILMATTGCAGADRAGPRQEPTPDDTLDTAITGAMDTAEIPGAIVGVWSPEREYVRAFGIADTTTGTPMKTDFFHRIGSVTKTFTATAVLQLAGDGRFGLDDPIGRYVDGVPGGESITVRQLAGMRSGLADYTRSDGFQAAVAANPRADFTPRQLLDWAFALPPVSPPDAQVEYCNTNYILLGLLVEQVTGASFGDYLSEAILAPLGMAHTSFPTGTQFPEPHARGYTEPVDGTGPPVDASGWSAGLTWAAGAMISTLEDMRIWLPVLASGSLLKPELQAERLHTRPEPGTPTDFGYGLGVFRVGGWIGHNGSVPGYQTVAVHLPEQQTTLVVMINTDIAVDGRGNPSGVLATAITEAITPGHVYRI